MPPLADVSGDRASKDENAGACGTVPESSGKWGVSAPPWQTPRVARQHSSASPSWRQRITGRWAISWQAYGVGVALNIPLLILTGGSIGTQPIDWGELPVLVAVGGVVAIVVALWLFIGERTWMRQRPVSLMRFGIFHLTVGAIFGVGVVVGDTLRDAPEVAPVWARILITMGIGLWFGTAMALVLEARDRYRRDREHLIHEAVVIEAAALRESEAAVRMRAWIDERVDSELSGVRDRVSRMVEAADGDRLINPERWLELSESLRQTAQGTVRTLSRSLWDIAEVDHPAPRLGSVLREFVRRPVFLIWPSVLIIVLGYLTTSALTFGVAVGAAVALTLGLVAGAAMAGANALALRWPRSRHAGYLIVLLGTQTAAALLSVVPTRTNSTAVAIAIIGSLLGMTVSVLLPSIVASVNAVRASSLADLRGEVAAARISEQAWRQELSEVTREVATGLHGTVQTRLIACAAAIDRAVEAGDSDMLDEALVESLSVLRQLDHDVPEQEPIREAINRVCDPWEPFCAISVSIDDGCAGLRNSDSVVRIVEEALSNAYRHGQARTIEVRIAPAPGRPGSVLVSVSDDGLGPSGDHHGLGSALFERLSRGRYSVEPGEVGGMVLVAEVTVGSDDAE